MSTPVDVADTDFGNVADGTSHSDEATEEDRRSIVMTGTMKATIACCRGGVSILVSEL
jgi:hypothetical protein